MRLTRRLSALPLTLFLILTLVLVLPAGPSLADDGPWVVSETSGAATIQFNGTGPQALAVGAAVPPGSQVRTGPNGRVTLSRGNSSMTLSPNSHTEVPADSDSGARTTIMQRLGSLLLKVDKRPEQHFEVKTPYLAAVVKGTTFTVNVDNAGASVHVVEGAVEVGSLAGGPPQMVRPGQTARVSSQPGAGVEVTGKGAKSSSRAPAQDNDGGNTAQGDSTETAEKGSKQAQVRAAGLRADAGPQATGGKLQRRRLVITETLGVQSIDISAATGGLVAAAPPRPGALAAVGATDAAQAGKGAAGKVRARSADLAGRLGGVPGDLGGAPGRLGGTGLADAASNPGAALSQMVGKAVSAGRSNDNAFGRGNGNAFGHDKFNNGKGKAKGKNK